MNEHTDCCFIHTIPQKDVSTRRCHLYKNHSVDVFLLIFMVCTFQVMHHKWFIVLILWMGKVPVLLIKINPGLSFHNILIS